MTANKEHTIIQCLVVFFFFVDAVMRSRLYSFPSIRSARTPAPCGRRVWALAIGSAALG